MAINLIAYFRNKGSPATGLTPIIDIWTIDGNKIVDGDSMTEIAGGFYTYPFTQYNKLYDYVIRCDGGSTLVNSDRYVASSNELDVNVSGGGLGLSGDIIWDLKKISDNMTTIQDFKKELNELKKEFKKIKLPKQDDTFFKDLKKYIKELTESTELNVNVRFETVLSEFNGMINDIESKYLTSLKDRDSIMLSKFEQFKESISQVYSEVQSKDKLISKVVDICNTISENTKQDYSNLKEDINNFKRNNSDNLNQISSKFKDELNLIKENLDTNNKVVLSKFSDEINRTTENLNLLQSQLDSTKSELDHKITESIVSKEKLEKLNEIKQDITNINSEFNDKIDRIKEQLTESNTNIIDNISNQIKDSDESIKKHVDTTYQNKYDLIMDNIEIIKQYNKTSSESDKISQDKLDNLAELRNELKQTKEELNNQIKSENKSQEVIDSLKQDIKVLENKFTSDIDRIIKKVKRDNRSDDLIKQLDLFGDKDE